MPKGDSDHHLRFIEIFSLTAQSISIICFLAIIIHNAVNGIRNPHEKLRPNRLLPLISFAVTAIVFIFDIAFTLTIHTKVQSVKTETCFTSTKTLMFFVYFFIILMFGTKISFGFFNYNRFVHLFPPPSFKTLNRYLSTSYIIAVMFTGIGVVLNSRLPSGIIENHRNKICWFKKSVIHYFMTIPIGIFLLINLCLLIPVVKRMKDHAQNSTSSHQSYQRMKACVILLLSSAIGQGIGWLIGPLMLAVDSKSGAILEWIFIVFNALDGVWGWHIE